MQEKMPIGYIITAKLKGTYSVVISSSSGADAVLNLIK